MEYIYLTIAIIFILLTGYVMYKKGIKKGKNDFLSILLASGFEHKIEAFTKQNGYVKENGIVFVGDSITQDFNVYEYFHGLDVYNRGIGGDTTVGLLSRMHLSIFNLKPRIVVILIGTNDFALLKSTTDEVYSNICTIIDQIKNKLPHTKIILQSVYPVNENLSPSTVLPRDNQTIDELNKKLEKIEGITFVNLFKLLIDSDHRLDVKYTIEGLHINEKGYELITKELIKYLK